MKKHKLEVEFDETFEASFRVGLLEEGLIREGFETVILDNLFQKFLREREVIKPNQDYILSIRKFEDSALDPDIEDCMKYQMRLSPLTKVEVKESKR